jgi:shikimate kinase
VAPTRIVLVGFMGVGKTTVGRTLAERLGWSFVDLDDRIEAEAGMTVAEIFARHGEAHFRDLERRAADAARGLTRHVVAAGGGAFVQPGTRELLRDGAATVWLTCDIDGVLGRIRVDGSRPLAADRERMQALLAQRQASYRMADMEIDTTSASPEEVAGHIVRTLFPDGDTAR